MSGIGERRNMNYLIDELSISLEDKSNDFSFKWLFDNTLRISMEYWSVIEDLYDRYIDLPEKMYRYVLSPEWGEASKNFRMRFLIVKIESDYTFVPFKIVDPIGHDRYFSISMEPISYGGIDENVKKVLEYLSKFDCIKYIAIPELEQKDEVDNNYYNLREDFSKMNKSNWRSKRGVNKLMKLVEFDNHAELLPGIEDRIKELNAVWDNIKKSKDKNFKLSKSTDFNLAKIAKKSESVYIYGFFYKGNLIGYSIASIIIGKYISLLATKQITGSYEHLSDFVGEDTEELKVIHKHLSSYMQYMIQRDILKDSDYIAVYNYGDTKVRGLKDFKNDYYSRRFSYNRYSLEDYMRRLEI